ncbi:MAG: hypothetical protein Q7S35_00600 [Candidatus Limnocylindrales bacterium]|nr:hypothetical protein [Candidatus Limnocylindrales bacterium]
MSRATRKAFERVDKNDPTLAVDGLSDFLPVQTALEIDPTLAVSTLGELFPERGADEIDDYFSSADDASTKAKPAETPVDDGEGLESEQIFTSERIFESDEVFHSDIQRAAMEFQRFAEKFHAFASECQHRGAV